MQDCDELAARFVSVWNETDATRRHHVVETLWADDGCECTPAKRTVGHDALEVRIAASHQKNVRDGGCRFELVQGAQGHHGVVKFDWRMTRAGQPAPVATGSYVLVLQEVGKITGAYFFADP